MRHNISGNHFVKKVRMPDVSEGICERCKKSGLLGNGVCANCWDRGRNSAKKISRLYANGED